jgi:hypothetical protein
MTIQMIDIHVHCYQKKTGKQFVDFLKRVDKRDMTRISKGFLVLDNLSVHKLKKVKEQISNKLCQEKNLYSYRYDLRS